MSTSHPTLQIRFRDRAGDPVIFNLRNRGGNNLLFEDGEERVDVWELYGVSGVAVSRARDAVADRILLDYVVGLVDMIPTFNLEDLARQVIARAAASPGWIGDQGFTFESATVTPLPLEFRPCFCARARP